LYVKNSKAILRSKNGQKALSASTFTGLGLKALVTVSRTNSKQDHFEKNGFTATAVVFDKSRIQKFSLDEIEQFPSALSIVFGCL